MSRYDAKFKFYIIFFFLLVIYYFINRDQMENSRKQLLGTELYNYVMNFDLPADPIKAEFEGNFDGGVVPVVIDADGEKRIEDGLYKYLGSSLKATSVGNLGAMVILSEKEHEEGHYVGPGSGDFTQRDYLVVVVNKKRKILYRGFLYGSSPPRVLSKYNMKGTFPTYEEIASLIKAIKK